MEPVRQEFAVDTPEIGWSAQDDLIEQLEEEDLRAFAGISLAVVAGLATWTLIYLILRFF